MLLILLFIFFHLDGLGPKKFVKEGRYWCRDRVSHPGRQCCDNVSQETPTAIMMQATTTTHINQVDRGYGHSCDESCKCTTKQNELKCKKNADCKENGPLFRCIKGQCKFPCTYNSDCTKQLGDDYACNPTKLCELKTAKKSK